jgi:hypothetical protein
MLNGATYDSVANHTILAVRLGSAQSIEQLSSNWQMSGDFAETALIADVELFGYVITVAKWVVCQDSIKRLKGPRVLRD